MKEKMEERERSKSVNCEGEMDANANMFDANSNNIVYKQKNKYK